MKFPDSFLPISAQSVSFRRFCKGFERTETESGAQNLAKFPVNSLLGRENGPETGGRTTVHTSTVTSRRRRRSLVVAQWA